MSKIIFRQWIPSILLIIAFLIAFLGLTLAIGTIQNKINAAPSISTAPYEIIDYAQGNIFFKDYSIVGCCKFNYAVIQSYWVFRYGMSSLPDFLGHWIYVDQEVCIQLDDNHYPVKRSK
jgi:hypothetical protein